jgi:M6 family metalloprotease-like protein
MKFLSEWYATVSENKFKIEWVILDKWVTLPNVATDYVIPLSVNLNNATNGPKLFKDAMDATDPLFDFTNIQTVNFILPDGQTIIGEGSQGFPWDQAVKDYVTKEGPISSFSIAGKFFDTPGREYWSYWAHEFGHAAGIPHVGVSRGETPPFNPWDLMGGQDGPSRELSGWLRFLANWLPDEKVYCKEATNIKSVELTLVPLSGEEPGLKLVVIPLSKTESHVFTKGRLSQVSCSFSKILSRIIVCII